MKLKKYIISCCILGSGISLTTSCESMLDMDSDYLIYADKNHLCSPADTVNSVLGILNKLQTVADRTNLLGEVRGDMVSLNKNATMDLRALSEFAIDNENKYNQPRDYYAIINNCNYFIAYADTALKNNRNQKIFEKEYAAVKSIRAWTYLQLVLNYGKVPFYTRPILTESDSKKDYPKYDLPQICDYFINDLSGYTQIDPPGYNEIKGVDSRLFFFPIYIVLGDLNLWRGNYKEAALNYYQWIVSENYGKIPARTTTARVFWRDGEQTYNGYNDNYTHQFNNSYYNNESVTIIPMDSAISEGNFSNLRLLYNSLAYNDYKASINPSKQLIELSAAQKYCGRTADGNSPQYVPSNLDKFRSGDLRLKANWNTQQMSYMNQELEMQTIYKFIGRNVSIYRKAQIYLRLAEALNCAGYPRFGFSILRTGVNNEVIAANVLPYCNGQDSLFVNRFDFPNRNFIVTATDNSVNTIGIHSRGSGYSNMNAYYTYPALKVDSTLLQTDSLAWVAQAKAYEISKVEDLIIDENALETSFEGYRFYDLMRVALRRNDNSYLADKVSKRNGEDAINTALRSKLMDRNNWYMKWKDQVGF